VKHSKDTPEKVKKLSEKGLSKTQIAYSLGVSRSTFYRWSEESQDIEIAFQQGKANAIEKVSSRAFEMAVSGKYPTFTMFWLRSNADWNDKAQQTQDNESRISIEFSELNL